jgi:hypothetical protein
MSLTLRSTKGSALTSTEMDNNWLSRQPINSVGSDVGDADVTLTVGTSSPIQQYATTLTGNRTVTLETTDAINGDTFRIVRTGLGAYTIDVGGLKTLPSATAAWCDVSFDGSAWILTAYGTL